MDARFYNSDDIDIERLANDLVNVYLSQGYQAQNLGNRDQVLLQLKKGGDFEAIIGMQAAVSLTIQRTAGGVLAMIGRQRWVDKAAVGAVGLVGFPILWPLALTAGAGALRQASLGNQVLNMVDGLVRQQRPGLLAGPIPSQIVPQIQRQWGQPDPQQQLPYYIPSNTVVEAAPQQFLPFSTPTPPSAQLSQPDPAATGLRCSQCNTPYEAGDTFCSGCGRALAAPRFSCPNCHTDLKPGTSFCPKCGASTFAADAASQKAPPRPATVPQPTVTYQASAPAPQAPQYQAPAPAIPTYTPPTPQPAPTYTPPSAPTYTPPVAPVYRPPEPPAYTPPVTQTPPVAPQPQVFYTASEQSAPSVPTPAPQKPVEPYYVPPETQTPPAQSQPKVTIVTSTPKQEPLPPQKPRPQKQYYVPSQPEDQPTVQEPVPQSAAAQIDPHDEPTIYATNTTIATGNQSSTPWGNLTFSDGQQIQLSSNHAVVGRYDHDLGGDKPEVDLSQVPAADTVSRIHAAFERHGGSYTLTDLNSTNATRINSKRLTPDTPTPIKDGDTLQFGKITSTFKQA